jgi:hypothetical protein
MRNIALSIIAAGALIAFGIHMQVSAQALCGAGKTCAWVNVSNVGEFGVSPSASTQNFYNDQATKDQLCRQKGYDDNYGGYAQQARWSSCNDEYHVDWRGYWDSHPCGGDSYLTSVYCSKTVVNNPPEIRWSSNPTSVSAGSSYTISASANDRDGDLVAVSIDKDGTPFAYEGGGNGYDETSGNPTSDGCGQTITYTAWATDSTGARSATISHKVTVDACRTNQLPDGTFNATCSAVSGTAHDPDHPGQSVDVNFVSSTFWVGSAQTNGATSEFSTPLRSVNNRNIVAYAKDIDTGIGQYIGEANVSCVPGVSVTMGASPAQVPSGGGNSSISWSAVNADSCTASGAWSGNKPTSGNEVVPVSSPSTYSITCTGPGGTASDYVSIYVSPPVVVRPNNSASLSLSKTCARPGENITFSSNAGGSGITSHIIEKDSNQDGIFGTLRNFGSSGGTQTHSESFGAGVYDFRTVVNNSTYSGVARLTVSPSCGGSQPAGPSGGGAGGPTGGGTPSGGGAVERHQEEVLVEGAVEAVVAWPLCLKTVRLRFLLPAQQLTFHGISRQDNARISGAGL